MKLLHINILALLLSSAFYFQPSYALTNAPNAAQSISSLTADAQESTQSTSQKANEQKRTQSSFKSLNDIEAQLAATDISVNHDGVRVSVDLHIEFAFGSAQIMDSAKPQIEVLAQALNSSTLQTCNIKLTGHTDATGGAKANLALSKARATSLKQALVEIYYYTPERLMAIGKGETELLDGLAPDDSRHRRVEVALINPVNCRQKAESAQGIEW